MKKILAWTIGILCFPFVVIAFTIVYLMLAIEFWFFNAYRHLVSIRFLFRHGWPARRHYLVATKIDFVTFCELRHGR